MGATMLLHCVPSSWATIEDFNTPNQKLKFELSVTMEIFDDPKQHDGYVEWLRLHRSARLQVAT